MFIRLIEHNRKVIKEVLKNNSKEAFAKREREKMENLSRVANEAFNYIRRRGRGDKESNTKLINEVKKYYKLP